MEKTNGNKNLIETMFKAGAHFAFSRSRRHPTAKPFVFGAKNKVEIFDLEKTSPKLEAAQAFVAQVALSGKQLLFVGGKRKLATLSRRRLHLSTCLLAQVVGLVVPLLTLAKFASA
jgi:ribosomal protein S2